MKLGSPSQRPDAATPSDPSSVETSAPQPGDMPRDLSIDTQERPRKARRLSATPRALLRAPKAPVVRNVQAAQQEIVKALSQGDIRIVHALLQQSADGRRLTEVLQAPADDATPASYQPLVDHMLANMDDAHIGPLVHAFGTDLLQALLEHRDLLRFGQCCEVLQGVLLPLASKDEGRLMRAAAKDLHALPILLSHLPAQHWPALLTAHHHEAITCLWRHAVHIAHGDSAQSEPRSRAFAILGQVFAQVPAEQMDALHENFSVQRLIQPARRNFPTEMLGLKTLLVQRGCPVPWEVP